MHNLIRLGALGAGAFHGRNNKQRQQHHHQTSGLLTNECMELGDPLSIGFLLIPSICFLLLDLCFILMYPCVTYCRHDIPTDWWWGCCRYDKINDGSLEWKLFPSIISIKNLLLYIEYKPGLSFLDRKTALTKGQNKE